MVYIYHYLFYGMSKYINNQYRFSYANYTYNYSLLIYIFIDITN